MTVNTSRIHKIIKQSVVITLMSTLGAAITGCNAGGEEDDVESAEQNQTWVVRSSWCWGDFRCSAAYAKWWEAGEEWCICERFSNTHNNVAAYCSNSIIRGDCCSNSDCAGRGRGECSRWNW